MIRYLCGTLSWRNLAERVNELLPSKKKSSEQMHEPQTKHKQKIIIIKKMIELASKNDSVHFVYKRIVKPKWSRLSLFVNWLPKTTGITHRRTAVSAIKLLGEKSTSSPEDAANILVSIANSF